MVLVGVAHHPLHGAIVILHLPAPLSSGRGGAAQGKPSTPPVGPAATGSASNGGHGCLPAPDGDAAGRQTAGGGETGGARHGRRDCRISKSEVWEGGAGAEGMEKQGRGECVGLIAQKREAVGEKEGFIEGKGKRGNVWA